MTTPVFPTLATGKSDSKHYEQMLEDPAMRTTMDGGYVVSRAKHTRKPRRTFTFGYTSISNADKVLLENFYDLVAGGSVIFDWRNPAEADTAPVYKVRFVDKPVFKYTGIGDTKLWDVLFKVEQA